MKAWYERLFEEYGQRYDSEDFTLGTLGEVDFIEDEIRLCKEASRQEKTGASSPYRILDIGCGTGRHAIELSKRGHVVTGIDLSASMLEHARQKAKSQGLDLDFRQHDARQLPFQEEFDMVIMLCEGGFPLMETDEENYQILQNAARAMRSPATFIFTTLNGLFPLFHDVKDFLTSNTSEGGATYGESRFDLMTFRDHNVTSIINDKGEKVDLTCNERYYVPSEITWMLKSLGFNQIGIYGAKLGAFSRQDALTTEDYEMLVIAKK